MRSQRRGAPPTDLTLIELAQAILDENEVMAIATLRPDGWPQNTLVGFVRDGFDLLFSVGPESQKLSNLRRDPRASIAVGGQRPGPKTARGLSLAARVREVDSAIEIERFNSLIWMRYPRMAAFAPRQRDCVVLRARPSLICVVDDQAGLIAPASFEVSSIRGPEFGAAASSAASSAATDAMQR